MLISAVLGSSTGGLLCKANTYFCIFTDSQGELSTLRQWSPTTWLILHNKQWLLISLKSRHRSCSYPTTRGANTVPAHSNNPRSWHRSCSYPTTRGANTVPAHSNNPLTWCLHEEVLLIIIPPVSVNTFVRTTKGVTQDVSCASLIPFVSYIKTEMV